MKVILGVEARFKLERLCDSVYAQECGGLLLGEEPSDRYWIKDIFPVPNIHKHRPRHIPRITVYLMSSPSKIPKTTSTHTKGIAFGRIRCLFGKGGGVLGLIAYSFNSNASYLNTI